MSQPTNWGVPRSGPASPATMAERMDDSVDALLASHKGPSRPGYAVAGTLWIDDSSGGVLILKCYNGSADIEVGRFVASTGKFTLTFDPSGTDLDAITVPAALAELADPAFLFGDRTEPTAASVSGGTITCNLNSGRRLYFTRTMAGNETLAAPANAPIGVTFYLLVMPGAHTLTFAAGYEGPGDALPDPTTETLLAIVKAGASRFLVHVVGDNYGDGS